MTRREGFGMLLLPADPGTPAGQPEGPAGGRQEEQSRRRTGRLQRDLRGLQSPGRDSPPRKDKQANGIAALDLRRRPQTWLKLLSLAEYLPVWFAKISNRGDEAYYLDFFAGPGTYANGGQSVKGSPVLACEAAAAILEWHQARGRTWTPHLRFVEPDAATRATLVDELTRFDGVVDYRVVAADAETALPGLLAESAGAPTLAFFDPWGYDVQFEWIAAFNRAGINEVLVSFDAQGILRNIAAGQGAGVTGFSGGDWWRAHVAGTDLDLEPYLRELALRLRRLFPYAGVQQLEFLSSHALRAVAQCCGSIVGREEWLRLCASHATRCGSSTTSFPRSMSTR